MKKMMTMAMMMVMTIAANAMSYTQARNEALYLSDKMAWELNLTDDQYDAVYEINLDYMMSVNGRNDLYGSWWDRRNTDLQYVLTAYQYNKYVGISYFYRPLSWKDGAWTFNVYTHYSNKSHFYKGHPKGYVSYKGGNNKKASTYYVSHKKPTSATTAKQGNDKTNKGNGSTWRNTGKNTASKPDGHHNNQVAQNNSRGSGSGHFGRR